MLLSQFVPRERHVSPFLLEFTCFSHFCLQKNHGPKSAFYAPNSLRPAVLLIVDPEDRTIHAPRVQEIHNILIGFVSLLSLKHARKVTFFFYMLHTYIYSQKSWDAGNKVFAYIY
eukprot:GEMP01054591.1.p2 GENE.GEMP01054591.1~~GEMP01054591.1.p2  ORF type:complete len:115 (-),score=5.27 GEMP01054591.1:755-1099(-)